eukprot:15863-Eustigmatos_ZCMA.PRE.1
MLYQYGTQLHLYINSNGLDSSDCFLVKNVWYHVAAVRSSGIVKLYTNGTLVGTGTLSGSVPSSANVVIGQANHSLGSQYFTIYMDEVR